MKTRLLSLLSCVLGVSALTAGGVRFTDSSDNDRGDLASTGRNRYFVLEPGYQLVLEGKEKGKAVVLRITVLNDTKLVDGVETRVVEEQETANGQLVEVSRNYFAISRKTSDVFCFGEDVDIYKNGKVVDHEGAWLSGLKPEDRGNLTA